MENKPGGLLEQPDCCMTEKDEARDQYWESLMSTGVSDVYQSRLLVSDLERSQWQSSSGTYLNQSSLHTSQPANPALYLFKMEAQL